MKHGPGRHGHSVPGPRRSSYGDTGPGIPTWTLAPSGAIEVDRPCFAYFRGRFHQTLN